MFQLTEFTNEQLLEIQHQQAANEAYLNHHKQIDVTIRRLGAVRYNFLLPETHYLATLIRLNETITGIVYGRYTHDEGAAVGRGALIATDQRVLLLDKKPLFMHCDEISYKVISAITYSKSLVAGTIAVHTRMGDISLRTFNRNCAKHFVKAIEDRIFEK